MARLVAVLTKNDPGSPNFERSPPSSPYGFSGFYQRTDSQAADYWNALQYSNSAERLELKQPRCFRCRRALQALVIHPDSQLARSWYIVTGLLLAYVATIFPYRLCFIEFRIGMQDDYKSPMGWKVFEIIVDVFFWIDLIMNFFLAVRDDCGNLITDHWIIMKRYVMGWFWIDLLACLDPHVVMYMLGGSGSTSTNKAIRFLRMYRLGRLGRLFKLMRLWRLLRLFRVVRLALKFPVIRALEKALSYSHTIAMIKLVIGILWLAHILGCGAYLVVSQGVDSETDTWLHRRGIVHATPFQQWVASCYFVLTTLLTVGFGDMYPLHVAEMLYHIVLQLVGTVLQCVVLSEISKALSGWREQKLARKAIQSNVNQYIAQTKIGPDEASALTQALQIQHHYELELEKGAGYDRSKLLQIIKGTFPHSLQRSAARRVFNGVCERNAFFEYVPSVADSNVSLAVAAFLTSHVVKTTDCLYHFGDRANNIFLVLKGIAAHVAQPSSSGGHVNTADMDLWGISFLQLDNFPFWLLPYDTYFGDLELVLSHGGRVSSVRAETDMELLSLPKAVLVLLSKDFPSFVSNLRYAAIERRRRFDGSLKRLVSTRDFQHFAASRIQEAFRLRRGRLKMLSEQRAREDASARAVLLPMPKPLRRSKQPSQRGSRQRRQIHASKIRQCSNSLSPSRASKARTIANADESPMVSMTDEEAAAFLPELHDLRKNQELLEKKRVEILQNQKTMLNVLSQLHIRLLHEQ